VTVETIHAGLSFGERGLAETDAEEHFVTPRFRGRLASLALRAPQLVEIQETSAVAECVRRSIVFCQWRQQRRPALLQTLVAHQRCHDGYRRMPMTVAAARASTRDKPTGRASWVVASEGDDTVITVEGKLDLSSAGAFAGALAAVGAVGSPAIVDMARVEAIDAGALHGLVRVKRLFEILGLGLSIRSASRSVERRLSLFHLEELIEAS